MSISQKDIVKQSIEQKGDSSWRDVLYEVISKANSVAGNSL